MNSGISTKKNKKGYVEVKIGKVWMQEHRLVVENYIGRLLNKEEAVHHINFCKSDNRIENLALFPSEKAHTHFHRQFLQFGMTQPRITEIMVLKRFMEEERKNNVKEILV